jgi:hypothetical protein
MVLIFIVVVDGEQLLGGFMLVDLLMALCKLDYEQYTKTLCRFYLPPSLNFRKFKLWRESPFESRFLVKRKTKSPVWRPASTTDRSRDQPTRQKKLSPGTAFL